MPSAVKTQKTGGSLCFDKRDFELRSGITPYVCSAWHDVQAEHELLTSSVFPELHRLCRERAVHFDPVHLQYIDNSDLAQEGTYLTSCFHFIRHCAPFFLCVLGERYGHQRDADCERLLRYNAEEETTPDWWEKNLCVAHQAGEEWVLEGAAQYASEVELQITQAAFRADSPFCHFYYRKPEYKDSLYADLTPEAREQRLVPFHPESDLADTKLRTLKQLVINKGHRVRYYATLGEFGELVRNDWKAVIDQLCPPLAESITVTGSRDEDVYTSWLSHEHYAEIRRRDFVPLAEHDDLLADLSEFALTALDDPPEGWDSLEGGNAVVAQVKGNKGVCPPAQYQSVLTLVGDRGSGKTSLLSHWVKEFTAEYGFVRVFTHYVGANDASLSGMAMLKRCMAYFSNELQQNLEYLEETGGSEESLQSLGQLFTAAISHQPCVIVLDGLDDLGKSTINASNQVRELSWLFYPLPPHVRFIVSSCRSDTSYQKLRQRPDTRVVEMPLIKNKASKVELLKGYLGDCYEKLSPDHLTRILSHRQTEKPLYVKLLGTELKDPHVLTELDVFVERYLETCSARELVSKMIRRWVQKYSWNINKNVVEAQGFKKQTDTVRDTSGWVAEMLRLLAVSRDGLTRTELMSLLQQIGYHGNSVVTECDWLMFCDTLSESIVYETPEGMLRYRHLHVREAIEHALLTPDSPQQTSDYSTKVVVPKKKLNPDKERKQIERVVYSRHIGRFFFTQEHSDRKLHELPWQLAASKDYVKLKQTLSDPSMLLALYMRPVYRSELLCLWAVLQLAGYDPSKTYTDMLALSAHINEVPQITISNDTTGGTKETVSLITEETESEHYKNGQDNDDGDSQQGDTAGERVSLCVGQLLGDLSHYDTALRVLSDLHGSLTQRIPLCPSSELILCRVEEVMASHLLQLDMLADSTRLYEHALTTVSEMLLTLMSPEEETELVKLKGKILTQLASLYIMQQKTKEADLTLRHARHCMQRSNCSIGAAQVLFSKGVLRLEQHQFEQADACFQEALAQYRKWFGCNHHKVADVLHEYAGLLCNHANTHRYEKETAKTMYREALELREQNYGKSHLIVAETLCHFGKLLKSLSDPTCRSEALSLLRRALDVRSTLLGPTHHLTKEVYAVMNDLEVALQYKSLPHFYSDRRPGNTLYTTLSWHEAELLQFQLKKSRRLAQKRNAKLAMAVKVIGMLKTFTNSKKGSRVSQYLKGPSSVQSIKDGGVKSTVTISDTFTISDTDFGITASERQGEEVIVRACSVPNKVDEEESEEIHVDVEDDYEDDVVTPRSDVMHSDIPTDKDLPESSIRGVSVNSCSGLGTASGRVSGSLGSPTTSPIHPLHDAAVLTAEDLESSQSGGRPVSRVEIKQKDDYLDSFCGAQDESDNRRAKTSPPVKLLRPQSAPYKMLQKYRQAMSSTSQVSVVQPHTKRQVHSAPLATHSPHQRTCQPPPAHAIHTANAFSVINGPQTSTESLLGQQMPHPVGLRVHHSSAWYHVPGRYTTSTNYYPPKRSQKRVGVAHKKLMRNLQTRNYGGGSRLLSSTLPSQLGRNGRF